MDSEKLIQGLHTRFEIQVNPTIDLNSQLFFMGSCFSENIGIQMNELGFQTCINPFGIVFNPVSIANSLEKIEKPAFYSEVDLYYHSGEFISLDHHGSFHNSNAPVLLETINEKIRESSAFLQACNCIFITLGSAFVYLHNNQKIVANCHKIPTNEFNKRLLSENEIIDALKSMVSSIRNVNTDAEIVFTVSPVKHLRDGVLENAVSKGRLLSALYQFLNDNYSSNIGYFPAHEIVTEELRDHRFYAEDLAHPSGWTILYIFNRFVNCKMDDRAREFIESSLKLVRMRNHRIMSNNAEDLILWGKKIADYTDKIKHDFPEKIWS